MKQKSTAFNHHRCLAYLPAAFLPAALFLAWLTVMRLTGTPISLLPTASDELSWYRQIASVVSSGMPLGYYGYNGTHALHGTFGPWGIGILLPYAIWGKLFGWGLTSMCIANVTFLGIALCLFLLLCRPNSRECRFILLCYCTLLMNIYYSAFSMGECLRWSMAILLCGCMVHIYRGYGGRIFCYILTPALLLFCSEAYLLLALFIPIYLLMVLPVRRLWLKLPVSLGITAVVSFLLRKLLHQIAAPYNPGATSEALSFFARMKNKIQAALKVFYQVSPAGLWKHRSESSGFPALMLAAFLVFLIFCILKAIRLRGQKTCHAYVAAAFLMIGSLGGYAFLYRSPSFWTLCRGLTMPLICGVMLTALYCHRSTLLLCVLCALLSLPSFYQLSDTNLSRRCLTDKQETLIEESREAYDAIFDISPENSRWENTIALYGRRRAGAQTALSFYLPENAGYNNMLNNSIICEAAYAVVYHSYSEEEQYETTIANLQANGYETVFQKKALTILKR
ncbi:MAG: hypothetical protein Q4E91_06985 [Lachnospiraceae bacterium]|nr:hypothetical protein [Lachnospiraceae bacterium]